MCGDRWRAIYSESNEDPAVSGKPEVIQTSYVEKAVEHFRESVEERKRVFTVLSALSFSSTPSENKTSSGFQHDSPRQQSNDNNTTTTTIAAVGTSTTMSRSRLQDDFGDTLAELGRLSQVWGDLSISQAWKFNRGYFVIEWFKTAMSPEMSVPYSMIFEAFERLAAFRTRITYVARDERFELNIGTLLDVMIKHIAASQLMRRGQSTLSDHVPWENRVTQALEDWSMMRHTLGTNGGCVKLLDGEFFRVFQRNSSQLEATVVSLEEEVQDLKIAEATVVSLKHEVQGLKTASQNLETTVQICNGQLNDLRISHAGLSNSNAMLNDELEKVRQSHVETCDGNNELEAEVTTLSRDTLQGTVRKRKDETEVLRPTLPSKVVIIDNDSEVYDRSFQAEGLKTKEMLAEAEEDLATLKQANSQLVTKHEDLQVELAALLRDKARLRDKAATLEECEHLKIENVFLKDLVTRSHRMIKKKKEELASVNARLTGSLSKAKDDHAAAPSQSNKNFVEDGAKKDIELGQAADLVSRLTDEIGKSKQEKARLKAHLMEATESLDQATSTITATNMHTLTAVNLRLEDELKAANAIIGQIRSTLLPCSAPANTVPEASTAHDSPDTAAVNQIEYEENIEWPSEAPVDPVLTGDTESDTWSTTMLTPPPGLDTPEVSYFPLLPRFDTSSLATLIKKGADGGIQIGDVPNRGDNC